jgi:hypothetical protein
MHDGQCIIRRHDCVKALSWAGITVRFMDAPKRERFAGVGSVSEIRLANTSLNENEPIVNQPEQALNCSLQTNMDALVMENTMVARREK